MQRRSLVIFLLLISLFFIFSAKTDAAIQSADINLSINPSYPKPNEQVSASLSSFSTDLNRARISWSVDGETMMEGIGKKNFSFKVGDSGFATDLEVRIETLTGDLVTKKTSISPTDIDMLWEAYDTYTPPFYKGKALPPAEGMIKVVAFPNTQNITGFSYKWKLDDSPKPADSGYEKNYLIYKNSYLEDKNTVSATVTDLLGNPIGQGVITVVPSTPKFIFYRKDQNLGIKWETALSDGYYINPSGDTLVAEPYFFYPKELGSNRAIVKWQINGEDTGSQNVLTKTPKNYLAVKQVGGQSGTAKIKVIINNPKTLFESIQKELNVSF